MDRATAMVESEGRRVGASSRWRTRDQMALVPAHTVVAAALGLASLSRRSVTARWPEYSYERSFVLTSGRKSKGRISLPRDGDLGVALWLLQMSRKTTPG